MKHLTMYVVNDVEEVEVKCKNEKEKEFKITVEKDEILS